MLDELQLAGSRFISSRRAARITGYTSDYIGQLCRAGKISCKLVGRNWYVLESAAVEHRKSYKKSLAFQESFQSVSQGPSDVIYYDVDDRPLFPQTETAGRTKETSEIDSFSDRKGIGEEASEVRVSAVKHSQLGEKVQENSSAGGDTALRIRRANEKSFDSVATPRSRHTFQHESRGRALLRSWKERERAEAVKSKNLIGQLVLSSVLFTLTTMALFSTFLLQNVLLYEGGQLIGSVIETISFTPIFEESRMPSEFIRALMKGVF